MNADTYITGQLAAFALQQGLRYGGISNVLMAAHVIRNRVEAGWFGGDWMQTIEHARDVEGNDWSWDPLPVDLSKLVVRKSLEKMDGIYHGEEPDVYTKGEGLYFADLTALAIKPWFVENILRQPEQHPRGGNVVTVSFFR